MTLWAMTLTIHPMGNSFTVTSINHRFIFLHWTFYEIIFVNESSAMSKVLERATMRGPLTLIQTLVLEGLIFSLAAGGLVWKERNN